MDHNLSRNDFILERPLVSMHGVVGAIAYLQSPIPVLQTAWSERDISWQRVGGKKLHMRHVRLHIRKGCDPHYLAAGNSLIDAYRNPPLGLSHCSRFSMCVIRYLRYRERAVNRTATSHSYRTTLNTQETSVSNGPCATALHAADQHPCGTPATAFDICARKATKNGWTTLLRLLSSSTQLSLAPYHL